MITIRPEGPDDESGVRNVNRLAFERDEEADVVDRLRERCAQRLSLVAVDGERIVGHILFTPATIESDGKVLNGMGLAPMAVLPDSQGQGIGSALARAGLDILHQAGQPFVIMLGRPAYYPRFGFVRASTNGIACEYEGVPEEAFMILELKAGVLKGVSGVARYRPEFAAAV